MKIIGCDFHSGYQQIVLLDLPTGEIVEKALSHERNEEGGPFMPDCKGPYEWGPKPAGSRSGSSGCWRS